MRQLQVSLCLVSVLACAESGPVVKESWADSVPPARTRPATAAAAPAATAIPAADADAPAVAEPAGAVPPELPPAQYAARFAKADGCEAEARRIQRAAPDRAWALLSACAERGKFTLLPKLVQAPWVRELQERNDAAMLVGRVVAARGGDVLGDLATLRSARVPIFGLETAMRNPQLYKGRVLLFRARVEEIKPLANKKAATVRLAQVDLTAQDKYVTVGGYRTRASGSSSASGSAGGSYSGTYGSASGEGSGSYSGAGSAERTREYAVRRADNDLMETGRVALARLDTLDPFLEPGIDVVVVGRFDGVREVPGEDEDHVEVLAVITLFGYFEPAKSLLAQ